ncbi:LPXTG cell wall anchor domain-containing protein [Bifidobacterium panos]|uniref:Adhesin n=1 Tax=Bifidobacterium panos TaxID=2675321 RepID=A0ABX1SVU8_9BIFI|nr:LPXTG cell wall anchor domain-containing protein [Bifidobacterium sp. DSM 109963]NMN01955.1 adhesin [Bifidobacterium sp. DSM 109963]
MSVKLRRWMAVLMALVASMALLVAATPRASAGDGGGKGEDGGGGDKPADMSVVWKVKDSWAATNAGVRAALTEMGYSVNEGDTDADTVINNSINAANAECVASYTGTDSADCRLVGVGVAIGDGKWWAANHVDVKDTWTTAFKTATENKTYTYNGTTWNVDTQWTDKKGTRSVSKLAESSVDSKLDASLRVIVLAKDQPAPPNYTLTGSTEASSGVTTAGQTGAVHDKLTLSRSGSSIAEDVSGKVTLHWKGVDGTALEAKKDFTAPNEGTSDLPEFWACDLKADWKVWPAGKYWFDVAIPQTSKMSAGLDLYGENEASESWNVATPPPSKDLTAADGSAVTDANRQLASGSLYTAHVRAQSNAATHLWLYDTIDTKDVWIGAVDKDDLSKVTVSDPSGKTVAAAVSVDDSEAGKRIVKARVDNTVPGQYVLNVPQAAKPTGKDYTIKDDSKVCYGGDNNTCQVGDSREVSKITPDPNKVWVLDAKGALTASDPDKTNNKGSDTKTFVTGDSIGAVVNGRIPGHLLNPFTSYSITDDWSDSAKWIDWNHKDQVKVYVDGKDETSNFDIAIDTAKHTTTATAKSSFLLKTAMGTKDRPVKLYIGGIIYKAPSVEYAVTEKKLTNSASEKWNNESKPTNDPPVWVRNPKPDKIWSADQTQASTASDSAWSNKVNADTHTFVPQDDFSVTVNGTLPKNLAANMTAYELGDDFSASAKYANFDSSTVRVTIDGKEATSSFDVHKEGNKIWVTGKQSLLGASANQSADRKVRVTIKGTFKEGVISAGQEASMTNGCWEKWNNQDITGNDPPVLVRLPKPDKTWSADQTQAASASDSAWKNNVNADTHTFVQQDDFGVTVNGTLPKNLAANMTAYELGDDFSASAKYVDLDAATVAVTIDGKEATSSFDVHKENNKVWVSAKQSLLGTTINQANDRKVRVTIKGLFKKGMLSAGQKASMTNGVWEKWNRQTITGNNPPVKEWSPNPDKSWIKLGDDGKWQTVIDPDETNKTGADALTFLDGDQVASVVNGTIANDLVKVTDITLTDDYTNADYIWDLTSDTSKIRVYEADATTDAKSSVSDIANKGKDVTSSFDIKVEGTKVTATAKAEYRAAQVGLKSPKQITLLLPGVINFANGKGAAQVRKDFKKAANAEVTFCTAADGTKLTNKASEKVNNETQNTNEPYICGYIPPNPKNVEAEASQGGDHEDINGKVVFPGQKVEYTLTTQPTLPTSLAYKVKTVGFVDSYDEYLTPDKQTLELTDLSTGLPVSKKKYTTKWDDAKHTFTVTITGAKLLEQWKAGGTPRLLVRFEGTVSKDVPATKNEFTNQYELVINNSITPSNEVYNDPPDITPEKADMSSKDATISIDGKTLLLGETGNYVVTLDAKNITEDNTAYKVQRLGMVDDFDDEYLSVDQTKIEVLGADGKDVTGKFNVQLKDGVVYVFAKTVDTEIPATGETVKGDPQPTDLKAYSEKTLDPLKDPSIDQNLLGQQYQVILPYTVVKVTDGYVVKNTATQITNDRKDVTNTVSNPLKPINPSKDVTVKVDGESMNGKSVYKDRLFLYQLDSSVVPANRAYQDVADWTVSDQLDPEYDQYTGNWAVYAAADLYKDGKVLAKKGDKLAGKNFDSSKFGGDLFTATSSDKGLVTIKATDAYLKLVSADGAHEAGWRAHIQCRRVKFTERHENQFAERFNGVDRESNIVWTKTPDLTPSISVEKWDTKSGFPDGDRDDTKDALTVTGDTDITFTITNTSKTDEESGEGAVFQVRDLELEDSTVAGDGTVTDLKYPDNWDTLVLKPGESVDVHGTLKGVTEKHTDRAKVSGTPLVSCPVEESDPFVEGKKTDDKTDKTDGKSDDKSDQSDDDGKSDKQIKTVTIDGQTYCADTRVESDPDDWSGKSEPLARTGAGVAWFAGIVILLAVCGLVTNAVYFQVCKRRHAA